MCRLMLAWISSETSTKLLGMPTYPDWSSSLVLDSVMPTRLSAVRCRLVTRVTLRQLPSSSSFVQPSSRVPLPTSSHPRSQVQNPLSGFAPKQTKESSAWQTIYIVLHNYLKFHSNIYSKSSTTFGTVGNIPNSWKQATIIPKYAKDTTNPSNYRPISLTICIFKTLEGMINNNMVSWEK